MTSPVATANRPRRSAADTRQHILAVAAELFYRDGVRATGIDLVAARADVAPTTLYRLLTTTSCKKMMAAILTTR